MKLEDVKAGDTVVEFAGGIENRIALVKVERVTKTMVVLESQRRYNKLSGRLSGAGQWEHAHIEAATEENRARAIQNTLNRNVRTALFLLDKHRAKLSEEAKAAIVDLYRSEKDNLR